MSEMNDREWEQRLAQEALPAPPEALRARLLARARTEARGRRLERVWRAALALAAVLLIAFNLRFGHVHEERLAALTGPPPVERLLQPQVVARQVGQHCRTLWRLAQAPVEAVLKEDSL